MVGLGDNCKGFTADQTAVLGYYNDYTCSGFTPICGAAFSLGGLSGLTSSCGKTLSVNFTASLSANQVAWINPNAFKSFNYDNLPGFTTSCLGFTEAQIANLGTYQSIACRGLQVSCLKAINVTRFSAFTSACTSSILLPQVSTLEQVYFTSMSRSGLSGFRLSIWVFLVQKFKDSIVDALTYQQMTGFPFTTMVGFHGMVENRTFIPSRHDLCTFTPATASSITWLKMTLSADKDTSCLNRDNIRLLGVWCFEGLRPSQVGSLADGLLGYVQTSPFAVLTPDVIAKLRPGLVINVTPGNFSYITSDVVYLPLDVAAVLTPDQLVSLSYKFTDVWPCNLTQALTPDAEQAFICTATSGWGPSLRQGLPYPRVQEPPHPTTRLDFLYCDKLPPHWWWWCWNHHWSHCWCDSCPNRHYRSCCNCCCTVPALPTQESSFLPSSSLPVNSLLPHNKSTHYKSYFFRSIDDLSEGLAKYCREVCWH